MKALSICRTSLLVAALAVISVNAALSEPASEQTATAAPAAMPEGGAGPDSIPAPVLESTQTTGGELLDLNQARQYMLKLINRDRKSVAAPPVVLDEIAGAAAQQHSDEMASNGYVGHWALDGRKPDQRYTEAGGKDADAENTDGEDEGPHFPLASPQLFSKAKLEEFENDFFSEKPPDDGHRVNIIDPFHTGVGIGLSVAHGEEYDRNSLVQEFTNHYGDYGDIPHALKRGGKFTLTGKLLKGVHLQAVDLRWEDFPSPMTAEFIDKKTSSYGVPDAISVDYFPEDDAHPIAVRTVDGGEEFSVDLAMEKNWKPGVYYVLVWAYINGAKEPSNISTRTFLLGPPDSR